jgi:hypothetical protein
MLRALIVALVVLLAACDTGPLDPLDVNVAELSQDPADLVGTWDLVTETTPGDIAPPMTVPVTRYVSVLAFFEDGTFERSDASGVVETSTWEVRRVPVRDGSGDTVGVLYVGDRQEAYGFGTEGDQLFLDYRPVDGPLLEFHRR